MKNGVKILLIAIVAVGCKKPYTPPAVAVNPNYLVVEGIINIGSAVTDSTVIKLSRTTVIGKEVKANPVKGASVAVEDDHNLSVVLTEKTSGRYVLLNSKFDTTHKYRLRIKTPDNKQYLSDFVKVNNTPPIDSISYTTTNNMLQLYVNSHDPKSNTHYYRWDYDETWQFNSKYKSSEYSDGTEAVLRDTTNFIYTCWQSDTSSNIILGTSAKLSQDIISQQPLIQIASTSEKIEAIYSIRVREYGLSGEAYTFYQNVKKNTEQLGSIFDAQPSEIPGNIHNVADAAEPVIGYISASVIQTKRIFINKPQLPQKWIVAYPYACPLDTAWLDDPHTHANDVKLYVIPLPPLELIYYKLYIKSIFMGYITSVTPCLDCTIRGTNKRPDFWPAYQQ